ncbi:DNA polymerase III subunit gamma/tau [Hyphomonas johnsonii]|uniref:DNA polymerase III subunit gamma/tau n=1 Tax=Hyphomonas johnsonii MHS-2 TaxID=1280950 RepID=A0A059FQY5_9PROT|nr:DNA polymerase III subunit gamma/tau [Hyphomonas johnsonii]KCZ92946.1 DNA polymerase III subunits gamma and tau [Hyphomonas johnsonii MHS-2]
MTESDTPERDDQTFSMFGDDDPSAKPAAYQVLARKYRPRLFTDLIGQEAMVRTLSNAFETGRIAHAFMLTGVRGVGKTTTARLLARGLNYSRDGADAPSIHLDPPGVHCEAIMASRHPDVLELDAASRTGVADMRDLLDGSRYAPVSARYKVYIIDEVHMLSTAAFNALLKTLEEPPPHVKFIFATTEIRKVPVTVLSRCQRFDLKRLDTGALAVHLKRVADREGAKVSEEGLALIARAAEGSVRDALSILDQAIVQSMDGGEVGGPAVRDMLGLGDRGRLLDAFSLAVNGDARGALAEIRDQVHAGADPTVILKDLMDIAADVSVAQATGGDYDPGGPADWIARTQALAQKLTPAQASRCWQILLSGFNDLQTAPDTATALNMVVLRLAAACALPSPEEAARLIAAGGSTPPGKPDATGEAAHASGDLESFAGIVARLDELREVNLQVELEKFVRPGHVEAGRLDCELEPGAPADLLARLRKFLEYETGIDWAVSQVSGGGETVRQAEIRSREERHASAAAHPAVAAALKSLPGAVIVDVIEPAPLESDAGGDNVIRLNARR